MGNPIAGGFTKELEQRFGTLQSALSAGTKVEGRLLFDRPVRIDGELSGEVRAVDALVLIGDSGKVRADIEAAFLIVMGTVQGTVRATERLELLKGGTVLGEIETPCFVMQPGSIFNGRCNMRLEEASVAAQRGAKGAKG